MDVHPTKNGINRYWSIPTSITPVISGLTLLIPFITPVITHLLSGMSHQVAIFGYHKSAPKPKSLMLAPPLARMELAQLAQLAHAHQPGWEMAEAKKKIEDIVVQEGLWVFWKGSKGLIIGMFFFLMFSGLTSGKLRVCYGKLQFLKGKSTISMAMASIANR